MSKSKVSRRDFLKRSSVGSIAITGIGPGLAFGKGEASQSSQVDRHAMFAALGDTLIPTDPGDPGYKSLESYKITEEVMKQLGGITDADLGAFDQGSVELFQGRTFLQLSPSQRADYLLAVIDGARFSDQARLKVLQKVYRQTRTRVFTVFYQNYPENVVARDQAGVPILKPGDKHQITNPNTRDVVTGWDIAGFKGQMSWQEEEEGRAKLQKSGRR